MSSSLPLPLRVDLLAACHADVFTSGPQWATESEDLDITLLSWNAGRRVEPHINNEVDVLWVGVEGTGVAVINGEAHELHPGVALLIPKGCERGVESEGERLSYLSIHRRRAGLRPTLGRGGPVL